MEEDLGVKKVIMVEKQKVIMVEKQEDNILWAQIG